MHPHSTMQRVYKPPIPRICLVCGKQFHVWPVQLRKGHGNYCSHRCCTLSHGRTPVTPTGPQRFWERVQKSAEPQGCWLWTAGTNNRGYGVVMSDRKHMLAHRVAYEIANGPIPPGAIVMHTCDNRPCVNPSHLCLGTPKANTLDMIAKGRHRPNPPRGERNNRAKLSAVDVKDIRTRYAVGGITQRQLATEYGVHVDSVRNILHRKTWQHVP